MKQPTLELEQAVAEAIEAAEAAGRPELVENLVEGLLDIVRSIGKPPPPVDEGEDA